MLSLRFSLAFIILTAGLALVLVEASNKPRSFIGTSGFSFATFTLIKSTTTLASTLTSTITCTTSTGTLTTCSAGRRRRGLFYDENEQNRRYRRGLFHNEEQTIRDDNASVSSHVQRSNDPVDEIIPAKSSAITLIPLELQAGHNLPDGVSTNRFLLAFGTSTVTSFTITTSTTSLTASCASITNFPSCNSG